MTLVLVCLIIKVEYVEALCSRMRFDRKAEVMKLTSRATRLFDNYFDYYFGVITIIIIIIIHNYK